MKAWQRWTLTLVLAGGVSLIGLAPPAAAQTADDINSLELLEVIHQPTAGVLKRGQYQLDLRTYGYGGVNAGIGMGLFDRFMFGVSWGGEGLIGYGDPQGNELPGVVVKYRLIEESMALPAITVGFDMQGHGQWYPSANRYLYKAPGAFAVASRNWVSNYGRFGIHAGANYNTVESDDDIALDGFAGIDFSFNEQIAVMVEYDLALDDNIEDGRFGEGHGYLNAGLRFTFAQSMVIQFDLIDLLNNSAETPGIGRALKINYVETFTF